MSRLLTADPKASYLAHADEIQAAIQRVLASGHYILGPEVAAFEQEFATYLGGGSLIGVANGTEALEICLRALGVGQGDFVATVANTVTATISAIEQTGARPVFVEIDPRTMVMNAEALEKLIATRGAGVKAVIPVHLYGHPADMTAIMKVAQRHKVRVIEDCAQAHGAKIAGRHVSTWGDLAAFSFYPTKNLGALGDGGAVFTRDSGLAEKVRLLRQYGWRTRYMSEQPGRNSRLDEMQAAILRVKLRFLDAENAHRRELAKHYCDRLKNLPLQLPSVISGVDHVWHQFVVRTPRREALRVWLESQEIICGVLYPVPVYRQPAYADPAVALPETEQACNEVLCLPCHPGLTTTDVDRVCTEIVRWIETA